MALIEWNKKGILSMLSKMKGLRAKLSNMDSNIQELWYDHSRLSERHATHKELNHLISQEEIYWRQRSRISWMRDGDRFYVFVIRIEIGLRIGMS